MTPTRRAVVSAVIWTAAVCAFVGGVALDRLLTLGVVSERVWGTALGCYVAFAVLVVAAEVWRWASGVWLERIRDRLEEVGRS